MNHVVVRMRVLNVVVRASKYTHSFAVLQGPVP